MFLSNKLAIIADDLTGANDTALQFRIKGCKTKILLENNSLPQNIDDTQVWAISTESRNIPVDQAIVKVKNAVDILVNNLAVEYFYKKIDSTMRGNIAPEILVVLESLNYDAALILPAFPLEGRTTVGGYHLLKGVPIQMTELACDPHSPICASYIPFILQKKLDEEQFNLIGQISLDTIMKGAGPILNELNQQIAAGKKLIVVDAVSIVDIEQVVLAMQKTAYKLLPAGSAGLAKVLADIWEPHNNEEQETIVLGTQPRLIISGSATKLTASQIKKLGESEDIENTYFIPITVEDVLKNNIDSIVERALPNLEKNNTVIIHSSNIDTDSNEVSQLLFENEVSKSEFVSLIVDFLALITHQLVSQKKLILITIGGETSFKCTRALDMNTLELVDAVSGPIPLCHNDDYQWIITKSGNLGSVNMLIDILRYLQKHEK